MSELAGNKEECGSQTPSSVHRPHLHAAADLHVLHLPQSVVPMTVAADRSGAVAAVVVAASLEQAALSAEGCLNPPCSCSLRCWWQWWWCCCWWRLARAVTARAASCPAASQAGHRPFAQVRLRCCCCRWLLPSSSSSWQRRARWWAPVRPALRRAPPSGTCSRCQTWPAPLHRRGPRGLAHPGVEGRAGGRGERVSE